AYLAVLGTGAIAVPLNPESPAAELRRELGLVEASLALVDPAGPAPAVVPEGAVPAAVPVPDLLAGEPAPIVERSPGDVAVLLFTSGTAGAPRPAMLTHRNLASNIGQVLANPRRPRDLEEVVLAVLPLFHVFGLHTVLGVALQVGGTAVLVERFDPRAPPEAIRRHRITVVTGVPTMWSAWADLEGAPADAFASVRLAVSGAAPLDPAVRRAVRERYGLEVAEGYGLTEASPVVTTGLGIDAPDGSIGVPLPGVSVRLVDNAGEDALVGDPGEIWVRGPNVFPGYWQDEEATRSVLTEDGWLRTGDVAVVDDDGRLFLVDRVKDVIVVSGFNVYPAEV